MDFERLRFEAELKSQNVGKDPDLPPSKKRGDKWVILGMIAGAVIGGTIGLFLGYITMAIFTVIGGVAGARFGTGPFIIIGFTLGAVIGGFAGGFFGPITLAIGAIICIIIGATIGARIDKYFKERKTRVPDNNPFIND